MYIYIYYNMLYLHMCTIIYSAHTHIYVYIYICFPAKIRVSQLGSSNRVDQNQPQDRTVFFCITMYLWDLQFSIWKLADSYIYTHKYYVYMYIYMYIYIYIYSYVYIYGDGSKPCTSGEHQNGNLHLKIYGIIHRFYHGFKPSHAISVFPWTGPNRAPVACQL